MSVAYAVVVPSRFGTTAPSSQVYARRRLAVCLVLAVVLLAMWFGAGRVLASRGGAPASTPAVRPAAAAASVAATYVVQPGDTMWSIAASHHGAHGRVSYVDALVAANGGTSLAVGQLLSLP